MPGPLSWYLAGSHPFGCGLLDEVTWLGVWVGACLPPKEMGCSPGWAIVIVGVWGARVAGSNPAVPTRASAFAGALVFHGVAGGCSCCFGARAGPSLGVCVATEWPAPRNSSPGSSVVTDVRINRIIVALALVMTACTGTTGETADPSVTTATAPEPTTQSSTTVATPEGTAARTTQPAEPAATDSPSTTARPRPDGDDAPDFTVELGQGGTFTLSDEQKPVYMIFWAEW